LAKIPRAFYRWASQDSFSVPFSEKVERGGVRLIVRSLEGQWEQWIPVAGGSTESLFARTNGNDGILRTPHLAGPVHFETLAELRGQDRAAPLIDEKTGTIEFWFRPAWAGEFPPPSHYKSEYRWLDHTLLHYGAPNERAPRHYWPNGLILSHSGTYGSIGASSVNQRNVKWHAGNYVKQDTGWKVGTWHHIALVWDASAEPNGWLRLYIDGKRHSRPTRVNKPERLGEDKSVRVPVRPPWPFQLSCMLTGRNPAAGLFDELRISRIARYAEDFEPVKQEFAVDKHTAALFHFNGSFEGDGISPGGERYTIHAAPGAATYH